MKKRICLAVVGLGLAISLCGCALFLVGAAGAAGGYALSKDTARLEEDASYGRAWSVTYKVINGMGGITLQDKKLGKIEAQVRGVSVVATVSNITKRAVRIDIKARKNLLPNMDMALEIINKIANQL